MQSVAHSDSVFTVILSFAHPVNTPSIITQGFSEVAALLQQQFYKGYVAEFASLEAKLVDENGKCA